VIRQPPVRSQLDTAWFRLIQMIETTEWNSRFGSGMATGDIKNRLLDVAVDLLALHGVRATTIREITDAADCNLASVNYYFDGKDDLVRQAIMRVFSPLHEARARSLAALLERRSRPTLTELVEAWIRPWIDCDRSKDGGRLVVRLLQQLRADLESPYMEFVSQNFDYAAQDHIEQFCKALPKVSRAEIVWRYELMRGATQHALANCDPLSKKLSILSGGRPQVDVEDSEAVTRQLVGVCTAIFKAPAIWTDAELDRPEREAAGVPAFGSP
jgi:AcrR family transcriptional regulator